MNGLDAIVFDFDGVIAESVDIKTEAFRDLVAPYPGVADEFIAYHLRHEGLSRKAKFEYLYDLLGEELTDRRAEALSARFSEVVVENIKSCPLAPGARELLTRWHERVTLFVASGTPEAELRDIVEAKGLSGFFRSVYGTPATKSEIVARILRDNGWSPECVLFVGDSLTDLTEAAKAGVSFAGRRKSPDASDPMSGVDAPVFDDLFGLDAYLEKLAGPREA
jgi:phosphoglycolate phosphatase-like HAD superfamily hydrolase